MQLHALSLGSTASRCGSQLHSTEAVSRAGRSLVLPVRATKDVQGRVVSVSMDKTAVVQVDNYVPHRLYGKRVRKTKKFFAHDETEQCGVGDTVEFAACKPVSKRKAFQIVRIVTKSDL